MTNALPHCPSVNYTPAEQTTVEFGSEVFRQMFDALASDTARDIFERLTVEPSTASELATQLEISIQNVAYHLTQLQAAELVVEAGIWYSTRGKEMSVYAPRVEKLVFPVPTPVGMNS